MSPTLTDADEPTAAPLIALADVALRVGPRVLFEHTTWTLRPGQHWAVVGPTGAGKSILLNAVQRRVPLVHGQIRYYFESDGAAPRAYLKRGEIVGISTETQRDLLRAHGGYHQARWQSFEGRDAPTVADVLTGTSIEHISPYEISPLRTDEAVYRQRRDEAVALLDIAYLLPRKIVHISHGEGRKVLLARALMQRPRVLILDDPFCGLDTASRDRLTAVINAIMARSDCLIILATGRADQIPDGITHVAQVEGQRLTAVGPLREAGLVRSAEKPPPGPLLRRGRNAPSPLGRAGVGLPVSATMRKRHSPTLREGAAAASTDAPAELAPPDEAAFAALRPRAAAAPGIPLIEMRDVTVQYGDVPVLRDVTWSMRTGEHWAIFGENGAGKTTLLSLILADNPRAYANQISLFGRPRGSGESIWDIKRRIGWVSPELHLYHQPATRCGAVVESGFFDSVGLYRAVTPDQKRTAHLWLAALGISHLAAEPFGAVSTGQQRLVLLARALVKAPDVLVLDEPCQGLDDHHRGHILHTLDRLCAHTAAHLVYVSHYWHEIPAAMTHVLHLRAGRVHHISERGTHFS